MVCIPLVPLASISLYLSLPCVFLPGHHLRLQHLQPEQRHPPTAKLTLSPHAVKRTPEVTGRFGSRGVRSRLPASVTRACFHNIGCHAVNCASDLWTHVGVIILYLLYLPTLPTYLPTRCWCRVLAYAFCLFRHENYSTLLHNGEYSTIETLCYLLTLNLPVNVLLY